jgi:hypothetical protein
LWKYIGNPKNNISSHALSPDILAISIKRSLVTPIIFLLSLFITFFVSFSLWIPVIGRYFPVFIPIVMRVIQKKHDKKTKIALTE